MIDEEEIKHLIKLNKNDLAGLAIKQNEAELQRLRDEVKKLTEEVRRLEGLSLVSGTN
jgi:cell division protein FtsB